MRKLTVIGAALLVMTLATSSFAGIDEGDWEVGLGGNFFFSEFHDNYGLNVTLGYFVTAEIEIGGWVAYHNQDLSGTEEFRGRDTNFDVDFQKTWWEIAIFGYYYFQVEGEWAPYIGGFLGYESGSLDGGGSGEYERDGFMLGGVLGVKYFVSEKTTIFIEYRLGWRNTDEWEWSKDSDYTINDDALTHTLLFGISVLF
jgi:opacity protein-like surface antigen